MSYKLKIKESNNKNKEIEFPNVPFAIISGGFRYIVSIDTKFMNRYIITCLESGKSYSYNDYDKEYVTNRLKEGTWKLIESTIVLGE